MADKPERIWLFEYLGGLEWDTEKPSGDSTEYIRAGKNEMNDKPLPFDPEIQVRTWVLGALAATLAARIYGVNATDADTAIVGAFIGAAYDFIAFNVKRWLKSRKEPQ